MLFLGKLGCSMLTVAGYGGYVSSLKVRRVDTNYYIAYMDL